MTNATTNDGFVTFDRVQKSYDGETLVVKDLNLSIGKGEFLTMLGPSGSGKTTCLMMLAGFETATNGEIRLDGQPINQVPPHKRGIGMVFQNYALFPHLTVKANVAFPLEMRNVARTEIDSRVAEALAIAAFIAGLAIYVVHRRTAQREALDWSRRLIVGGSVLAAAGLLLATDVADFLTARGMPSP